MVTALVILLMIPFAFQSTAAVFVGSNIGKRNIEGAQFQAKVVILLGTLMMLIVSVVVGVASYQLSIFYTDKAEVIPLLDNGF